MEQEPLFQFNRGYIESPCELPPVPTSKAEALFLLSPGGRYCLGDVLCILDANIEVLNHPNLLTEKAIAVNDTQEHKGVEKTPARYLGSLDEFTVYFSGFGALGRWLSDTYALLSDGRQTLSKETVRCLDVSWMEGFAKDTEAQQNIEIIECLHRGVQDITDYADRRWNVNIYWTLVLEHLMRAADENSRKYGTDSLLRDKNNRSDRKKLFKFLKKAELFDVQFRYFISRHQDGEGDEEEVLSKSCYQPQIDRLKEMLLSRKVWGINEVYETLENEIILRQGRGYAETVPYAPHSQQTPLQHNPTIPTIDESNNSPLDNKDAISENGGEPTPVESHGNDNRHPLPLDQHDGGTLAPLARGRNYSEAMSKTALLRLAREYRIQLSKIDLADAISKDPECCKPTDRKKRHQFDMNTPSFSFLKCRGKQNS